jgi:hypothetical protein
MARPRFPVRRRPTSPAARTLTAPTPDHGPPNDDRVDGERPDHAPSGRESRDADVISALRAVDRAYDAAALCAAPLVFSRDWRRVRALADALRDLRDSPRPNAAESRRAAALCAAIRDLAATLARDFPAPGRKRARSPLGNALRALGQSAGVAVEVLGGR